MQTSMVFSQKTWPGIDPNKRDASRDWDDCWAVSAIQCMNVTAPWLRLVSVRVFRKAAENADVAGESNGGQLRDIKRGCVRLFPDHYAAPDGPRIRVRAGDSWDSLVLNAKEHRPISVAVVSGKLPTRLQFGFTGRESYHQLSLAVKGDGTWLVANPLAPAYSRWVRVNPAELRPAVMAYGRAKVAQSSAWYVAFPTDAEMLAQYHAIDDTTPFDQDDVDRLTAAIAAERDALQGRIDSAVDILDGDTLP